MSGDTETGDASRDGTASFANRLASRSPAPGGGAAAARAGRHAAALAVKVLRITRRKADDATAERLDDLEGRAEPFMERFRGLEESDQQAFLGLLEAMRRVRKKTADPDAGAAQSDLRAASKRAIEVPLETMDASLELGGILEEITALAAQGKVRAEADVGVAAELCAAAFRSSTWNVRANLPELDSEESRTTYRTRWRDLESRFETLHEGLRRAVGDRLPG